MKAVSPVASGAAEREGVPLTIPVAFGAYAGFCCWKYMRPSVVGAASMRLLIFMRPVGTSHRRSHHSGWLAKAGLVTPAINPGTFKRSSILVRSV